MQIFQYRTIFQERIIYDLIGNANSKISLPAKGFVINNNNYSEVILTIIFTYNKY